MKYCRHQWITTVPPRNRHVKEITTATCVKCGEVRRWTWPTPEHKQPDSIKE